MNKCLSCGDELFGRADKKFCSDQCRNDYNNKLRQSENNYVRNINNILKKNRRILESELEGNLKSINRDKLLQRGLTFIITPILTSQKRARFIIIAMILAI